MDWGQAGNSVNFGWKLPFIPTLEHLKTLMELQVSVVCVLDCVIQSKSFHLASVSFSVKRMGQLGSALVRILSMSRSLFFKESYVASQLNTDICSHHHNTHVHASIHTPWKQTELVLQWCGALGPLSTSARHLPGARPSPGSWLVSLRLATSALS